MGKVIKPTNVQNKNAIEDMEALFTEDFVPQIVSKKVEMSAEILERCSAFAELQAKTDFSPTSKWNEKGKPIRIAPLYTGVFKMDGVTKKGTTRKKINNPQFVPLSRAMHKEKITIEQAGHIDKNKVWFVYINPLILEKYQKLDTNYDVVVKEGYVEDDFGRIVKESDIGKKITKVEITAVLDKDEVGNQISIKPENPVYKFVDTDSDEEKALIEKIEKAEEYGRRHGFVEEESITVED